MNEDEILIKKRFIELSDRAEKQGRWVYSEFLDMAGQSILVGAVKYNFVLDGGYASAERQIACFGSAKSCGYEQSPPIECICIKPVSQKFSELSHRDFLGSLMALGLKREVLGDIIVQSNCGYLFCLDSVSDYIMSELQQVRHTTVRCSHADASAVREVSMPETTELIVASERADAAVSAVYKLSRNESMKLFEQKKIFVNSRQSDSTSHTLAAGDVVSVRGFGRFIYHGIDRETKKGRLRIFVTVL